MRSTAVPRLLVPVVREPLRARLLRRAAFPVVLLVVLGFGGWEAQHLLAPGTPTTAPVRSPAVVAAWGRLVVLRTTVWSRPDPAAGAKGGVVVDVLVRVVGSGTAPFDPADVTLRTDGAQAPVTLGADRPVRPAAGAAAEGHLAFVVSDAGDAPVLAVRGTDGTPQLAMLRPAVDAAPEPGVPPVRWVPVR